MPKKEATIFLSNNKDLSNTKVGKLTLDVSYAVKSFRQKTFDYQNQKNTLSDKRGSSHLRFIFLSMIYFVFKFPDSSINFEDKIAIKKYNPEISPPVNDESIAGVGNRSIELRLFKKEDNVFKLDVDSKNWLIKNPNSNFEAFLLSLKDTDSMYIKQEKAKLFSLWSEYGPQIEKAVEEIASMKGLNIVDSSSENNNENSLENNNSNGNSLLDKMNIKYLLNPESSSINDTANTSSHKMNRNYLFHHENSSTNLNNANMSKNHSNENSPLQKRKYPFDEENNRNNSL